MNGANMLINSVIQKDTLADKVCLVHGNYRITYSELDKHTDCLAGALTKHIKKGDRVLVQLSDPIAQLQYFFAIIKAGGACVFIDVSTAEDVTAELIRLHSLDYYINDKFEPGAAILSELPAIGQEDIFFGALSSGTTGIPKLIWRDHMSWMSAFQHQSAIFNLGEKDTIYLAGSLVYSANLNSCLHMLFIGGTVVIAGSNKPSRWVREIADYQVTAIFMVPSNYKRTLKVQNGSTYHVKSIISAGSKLDLITARGLMEAFPCAGIIEYYGASEVGHVSYLTGSELLAYPDSVGRAFPGVAIQIVNEEIWIESPYLAPAYKPKASIGDLGRIDQFGYLYLLGRSQGIINTGGVKVVPEQVEAILLQCPGVAEAAVSGVDDPVRGQSVRAWLVRNDLGLKASDVIKFCRKKMLPNSCPRKIVFIDSMPLNASGKIDRLRLLKEGISNSRERLG